MIAMIFAAGKGTRLRPLTDTRPKALVEVDGTPLLQLQLDRLYSLGVRTVIVNVHHFAQMIVDWLRDYHRDGLQIFISDESQLLLNTGGGLKKAGRQLYQAVDRQPILIHNVDILDNADLSQLYNACPGVDAVVLVSNRQTQRYLLFDDDMRLSGWTNISTGEVKTPYQNLDVSKCSRLAFAGIHVVAPRVIDDMAGWPDVFSIIDFYIKSCDRLVIKGMTYPGLRILDVGKPETLAAAPEMLRSLQQL